MKRILTIAAATAILGLFLASPVAAQGQQIDEQTYQSERTSEPIYDLSQNPGCGVTGLSREEKIARNIRIAKYYFQYWSPGEENLHYVWETYGCWADTYKIFIPILSSFGAPPNVVQAAPLPEDMNDFFIVREKMAYSTIGRTGLRAVPGSLRVHADENLLTFTLAYGGVLDNGEFFQFWEVVIAKISDAGQITELEFWHDFPATYRMASLLTGSAVESMDSQFYAGAVLRASEGYTSDMNIGENYYRALQQHDCIQLGQC